MNASGQSHALRRAPLALAGALVIALAACGVDEEPTDPVDVPPPAPEIEEVRVEIVGNAFSPAEVSTAVGVPILWINLDEVDHTITHGENGEPVDDPLIDTPIEPNQEQDLVFDEPGTYSITCTIHPEMNMTVVVEDE